MYDRGKIPWPGPGPEPGTEDAERVIAYVDSSALVKLLLDEHGSDIARGVWESGALLATSRIAHAELACALERPCERIATSQEPSTPSLDGTFLSARAELDRGR